MSIRLDAIPLTGLPQVVQSEAPHVYTTRVNCVLHSGQLPASQHLEVSVNGAALPVAQEGNQSVFSWQFVKASDEVHIQLLSRGVLHQHWQGCWNERDAILHMGTLPVQVFFNGKSQPMVPVIGGLSSAATLAALRLPDESGDGNEQREGEGSASENGTSTERQNGETQHGASLVVQDLLVTAVPRTVSAPPQEEGDAFQPGNSEWQAREESRPEDEEESEPGGDEARSGETADEVELEEEEVLRVGQEEEVEVECEEEQENSLLEEENDVEDVESDEEESQPFAESGRTASSEMQEEQRTATEVSAMTGMRVAAFHASPYSLEETLQALQTLVASMPSKTIIVDLRHHSRPQGRNREQSGLSQKLLRSVFGGKYWDRSWAIEITYRGVAPTGRSSISQWRRVVANPDRHPEGIPSLVSHLREGYAAVVMDSTANYEDSLRKAVIDELEHRLPGLEVGPVG